MHPPVSRLLYLHGFRSSPRSSKARRLAAWLETNAPSVDWRCPALPPSPSAAWRCVAEALQDAAPDTTAVVGSSLGGFFATAAAEAFGCRCAVINPAVEPARDLARHLGEQTTFHSPDERFFFRAEFVDELRALAPPAITRPERYLAIVATGDEVLDRHEMAARYEGARLHLVEGSDHALSDFERHLPVLLDFLGLREFAP